MAQLPSDSVLQGGVHGQNIHFLKTYQGEHFTGYQIGDQRVGITIQEHVVQYYGRISADGTVIEGKWLIPASQPAQRPAEGPFALRREPISSKVLTAVASENQRSELMGSGK